MRLIDADELIKNRVENDPVVIAATCAPTAYDVDKVLKSLKEKSFIPGDRIGVSDVKIIMAEKAINIVKSGGVSE